MDDDTIARRSDDEDDEVAGEVLDEALDGGLLDDEDDFEIPLGGKADDEDESKEGWGMD